MEEIIEVQDKPTSLDQILHVMQLTAQCMGSTEKTTNNMIALIQHNTNDINALQDTVSSIKDKMNTIVDDVTTLKYTSEIDTKQHENITKAAKRRVFALIGYDPLDQKKYFRTFIAKLYNDTKKYANLGPQIAVTHKEDYDNCMNYINTWVPYGGVESLKKFIDRTAKAKRKAKKKGYK